MRIIFPYYMITLNWIGGGINGNERDEIHAVAIIIAGRIVQYWRFLAKIWRLEHFSCFGFVQYRHIFKSENIQYKYLDR